VNAALVSVGQTAATRNGRQLLATTALVTSVAERALSSTGRSPRLLLCTHTPVGGHKET